MIWYGLASARDRPRSACPLGRWNRARVPVIRA